MVPPQDDWLGSGSDNVAGLGLFGRLDGGDHFAVSAAGIARDVKQLRRGMGVPAPRRTAAAVPVGAPKNAYVAPKKEDNVLYILDDNAGAPIATKNYRLQVQR